MSLTQIKVTTASRTTSPSTASPSATKSTIHPKPGHVFFDDGVRRIDFVLVFDKDENETGSKEGDASNSASSTVLKRLEAIHINSDSVRSEEEREKLRTFFESNLVSDGLELEEDVRKEDDGRLTIFVKVHAPWAVLCKQAEILKMKMPLKLRDTFIPQSEYRRSMFNRLQAPIELIFARLKKKFMDDFFKISSRSPSERGRPQTGTVRGNEATKKHQPKRVTWQFRRKKLDRFDITDESTFFSPTQRMEMVWEIMQRVRNDPDDEKRRGIEMLLHTGVYDAAFPLHDASDDAAVDDTAAPISQWPQRKLLRHTWAGWKAIFKRQPLELIRSYYGEKIAFYFAFLGFYTNMLIFPAIFGICAVLFGKFYPLDDTIIEEICNRTAPPGTYYLCPICDPRTCEFVHYYDHCEKADLSNWMDNEATIVVAIVTVAWATIFLKSWKRREAELAFDWDVYEVEKEDIVIRPDYERRAPTTRPNPVTRQPEPYVPSMMRLRWKAASTAVTLLMLLLVACALVGLVMARIALYDALKQIGIKENIEVARFLIHGLIFVVVVIFDWLYNWVAEKVTSLECPRTQSEWLSSFLRKVFMFELLNDFVPIAYAAWVKGKTVRTPLDLDWKSELCDATGCMGEVTELIVILLLARLVVGNAAEIGIPYLRHYLNKFVCDTASTTGVVSKPRYYANQGGRRQAIRRQRPRQIGALPGRSRPVRPNQQQKAADSTGQSGNSVEIEEKRWRSDVLLGELELDGVATEYMEMIVQFAFCTLFVPAFPVAALICLVNNIFEIRVDSIKILASHRRPLPIRVSGIGIWKEFMGVIVKLAVLSNAGLIAFTSDAVIRFYYNIIETKGFTYSGYPTFGLSSVSSEALINRWHELEGEIHHLSMRECYYAGFQEPDQPYENTATWWRVWCVRMAAFGIFVAIGFTFQFVYDALVPDIPDHVEVKIQRQRYVLSKAMESEATYEMWLRNHNVSTNAKREETACNGNLLPIDRAGSVTSRKGFGYHQGLTIARPASKNNSRTAWGERRQPLRSDTTSAQIKA